MKKLLILLISILIIAGCSTSSGEVKVIAGEREDGKYSGLNNWLFNDLHLAYTPTFIIVDKNNKIVYFNDGEVNSEKFKEILNDIQNGTLELDEQYKMDNLGKEFYDVDFIEKGKMNVIEIVWTQCSHCEVQIKENNPVIISENPSIAFVEYFPIDIQSNMEKFIGN